MKTEIKKTLYKVVNDITEIPKGKYNGIWCGYEIQFEVGDQKYMIETVDGIRGMSRIKINFDGTKFEIL